MTFFISDKHLKKNKKPKTSPSVSSDGEESVEVEKVPVEENEEDSEDELDIGSLCDEGEFLHPSLDKSNSAAEEVKSVEFLGKNPENDMMNIRFDDKLYCYDADNTVYNIQEDSTYKTVGVWNPETSSIEFEEY